ncbi:hypothetical protein HNQ07_000843 [Deinococcus metalli]|uniref:DUF4395 domain-containing protein n=1 Tax=Deinococcus metalli TaxID=1141878 RepID=A0A7W8KC06_9DEIO|nr:DUF4395 domain-containing protein [Deinococcus metalli]MBB5375399.1 hypothetical protein [Deinococcus metalli]GHF29577.1 hypothetical protein GCM10017781_01960 [Deinococcus metalli]
MIGSPSPASSRAARTDLSALRFNQVTVIAVTALAVVLTAPLLTLLLGAAMLLGAVFPDASPLRAAYRALGRPLGLKPDVVDEDPRAHHFAQGVGGTFLLASALVTLAGLPVVGAVLGLVVIALAALNLTKKICVGCLMYFQYRRLRYAILSR